MTETQAEYTTDAPAQVHQAPHRYLMDEHVHSFYPSLAERIGLNEAIVLQQVHSWIRVYLKDPDRYREKHYHDGHWWTWDSYPDWHKKLPYLSESTIKRALLNLRENNILKTANYNTLKIDRTLWYTIDYEAYDKLWSDQEAKVTLPSDQNDQMEKTNLTSPLPASSSPDSSSAFSAEEREGATAPPPPADDDHITYLEKSGDPPEEATLWPETIASLGEENPAKKQVSRMRSKMGSDPLAVAAHCQQQQAVEGTWTVPVYSGLSPACAVFKEATGYRPGTAQRPVIDETVPDNEEALHNWFKVCQGWMLTYNNHNNVAGMLDWYAEGRVGRDKPNGGSRNGGPSTPREYEDRPESERVPPDPLALKWCDVMRELKYPGNGLLAGARLLCYTDDRATVGIASEGCQEWLKASQYNIAISDVLGVPVSFVVAEAEMPAWAAEA